MAATKLSLIAAAALLSSSVFAAAPLSSPYRQFSYQGCYTDNNGFRALSNLNPTGLNGNELTIEACIDACGLDYAYVGLSNGNECWCGNTLNSQSALSAGGDADCPTICTGNNNENCGGPNRLSVYKSANQICPGAPQGAVRNGYQIYCGSTVDGLDGSPDLNAGGTVVNAFQDCITLCDNTATCGGFSYITYSSTCYLHGGPNGNVQANRGWFGAIKADGQNGATTTTTAATTVSVDAAKSSSLSAYEASKASVTSSRDAQRASITSSRVAASASISSSRSAASASKAAASAAAVASKESVTSSRLAASLAASASKSNAASSRSAANAEISASRDGANASISSSRSAANASKSASAASIAASKASVTTSRQLASISAQNSKDAAAASRSSANSSLSSSRSAANASISSSRSAANASISSSRSAANATKTTLTTSTTTAASGP